MQEALTNCARHAKAGSVRVSVSADNDTINVVVRDDGIGFDSSGAGRGGLGLLGMKERVQALDGNLTIASQPKSGTTIYVQIPIGVPA